MSLTKLILAGLRYYWRGGGAVLLAVAAATAVLTGALVVGDSMRGSLRHLLLDQLGSIDDALVTDRFFRADLAAELAASPRYQEVFGAAVPCILVQGSVEHPRADGALRAAQVSVIGCDERFWKLGSGGPNVSPQKSEIVLNAPLAAEIGARVGDDVLLRIGSVSQIPPDSALGRKTETIRNRRLKVTEIIPAEGLGRFALFPSQQMPSNAFVATEVLQDALEQPGKVNAIFVAGKSSEAATSAGNDVLAESLHPTLADYGLQLEIHVQGYGQWTSNRMLLDPAAVTAIDASFAADRPQALFTYLANTIAAGGKEIPYSTITAMDFVETPPLGPLKTPQGEPIGPLADDEIVLNTWAVEELGVEPGAEVEITYFEPESTHAEVRESKARFRLKAVVALEGLAADKDLTPQLPGITDRATMGDWDAPFPFDSARVRKKDEKYWDDHRTTPKAFISLAAGRRMWSSRFGNTTAVRFIPPAGANVASLSARLKLDPAEFGFRFLPLKRWGLTAAQGTTGFGGLFIGFSFFIMASALMLVALVFRLGIEERSAEVGILRALGIGRRRVLLVLAGQGLVLAKLGALLGVLLGVAYAQLMLLGLTTWWLGAIGTPFLRLHVTWQSLLIGYLSGLVVCLLTVLWTLRRLGRVSVRRLLAHQVNEDRFTPPLTSARRIKASAALLLFAVVLALSGSKFRGEAQAGAFVGSGALVLAALLTLLTVFWRRAALAAPLAAQNWPLARLALRNAARNPGRSTLSVALIAIASFLIVALSAFRLNPAGENGRDSGSGGFSLVAQSDQPIYQNLDTRAGRAEAGFGEEANDLLSQCGVYSLRVRAGDDASCLNLYQPTQPRMLGVPQSLVERGGFAWASSAAETDEERANPWLLLDRKLESDADGTPAAPMVLDFNTAEYSLHKGRLGESLLVEDSAGKKVRLVIVGMLKNSIFQGDALVAERALLRHFPHVSGYRFFLVEDRGRPVQQVQAAMENALGDFGFDAETSAARLTRFFAVQNTYLSTFQSLGGLGLLLGTFGLATVQLRNVLERRGELALLRASGFRRRRLAELVALENLLLLVGGLKVGVFAALVAVLPHWLAGGAAVPWLSLAATLLTVLVVGMLAGLIAVRYTLRADLVPALRAE